MAYQKDERHIGSQGRERDTRKTPGKGPKMPPMGAKRKIAPRKRPA